MLSTLGYLGIVLAALVGAGVVFVVWVGSRKRIATETIGRATEDARRIVRDAERDAETRRKETLLDAKEQAHEILTAAERQARSERQQSQTVEQALIRREAVAAERQASVERLEKELQARERAVGAKEAQAAAAAERYEQLVAQQKHDLERVAGLTADEAKELLIRQIESDARHDAANLLKRLEAEARETAADRAKQYITEAIQRSAAEHAVETTVSVVDLPSDDLK